MEVATTMQSRRAAMDAESHDVFCPLTLDVMRDPVTAEDGWTYERETIAQWFAQCGAAITSPCTGKPMGKKLVDNATVRAKTNQLRARNAEHTANVSDRMFMLSSGIFEDLDRLEDNAFMQSLGLKPPTIVVMGNQSDGKSTALERLCGFPIFPRSEDMCTRAIIRVHLRRGPAKLCTLCVRMRDTEAEVAGTLRHVPLVKLCSAVKELMDECVKNDVQRVSLDKELFIKIQVPYCPNLDVLDVPGLVTLGANSVVTRQLAESVVDKEKCNAFFLLVNDIRVQPHQCTALEVLRLKSEAQAAAGEATVVLNETLGVFTKLDLMGGNKTKQLKDLGEIFAGADPKANTAYSILKKGWVMCASPEDDGDEKDVSAAPPSDTPNYEVLRLHRTDLLETCYFRKNFKAFPHIDKIGMESVRRKVEFHFEDYIVNRWVRTIREHLHTKFEAFSVENLDLRNPIPKDEAYEEHLLKLRRTLPTAHPGYDVAKLASVNESETKTLLKKMVIGICTHAKVDWTELATYAPFQKAYTAHVQATAAKKTLWATPMPWLTAMKARKDEEAAVTLRLKTVVKGLVDAVRGKSLLDKFDKALFPPVVQKTYAERGAAYLRGWYATPGAMSEEQAATMKLSECPELRVLFLAFLSGKFAESATDFESRANCLIEANTKTVSMSELQVAGAAVNWKPVYFPSAEYVSQLADEILLMWGMLVVDRIQSYVDEFAIVPACMKERCRVRRIEILKEMVTIADVLQSLKDLEGKVERKRLVT